jgi:hypothetical protein
MPHHIRHKLKVGYKTKPIKHKCCHSHKTLMASHKLYKIFFPKIKDEITINVIN